MEIGEFDQAVTKLVAAIHSEMSALDGQRAAFFAAAWEAGGAYSTVFLVLGNDGYLVDGVENRSNTGRVSQSLFDLYSAGRHSKPRQEWSLVDVTVERDGRFNVKLTYEDQMPPDYNFLESRLVEVAERHFPGVPRKFWQPPPPP